MAATVHPRDVEDELFQLICSGSSVQHACKAEGCDKVTFYRHLAADEAFATRIARAREVQQEALCDEMDDLAQEATSEDWQVKRLQIWTRQWTAAKLAPKKYGEKIEQQITGKDGGPLTVSWLPAPPK